ncbi:MAG: S8 family serine peptidase, partial [Alphaproteobacteria bacterium]
TQSSTAVGHSNAALAVSVGAAFYGNTPAFGTNPPVKEGFSSFGNAPILFDGQGNRLAQAEERAQPLFVATDGVNNTFFGGDVESDGNPNFFGTSAAAPNAAAAATLLLEFNPNATPDQINEALIASAIDMDNPNTVGFDVGYDAATGFGLIQVDVAATLLNIDDVLVGTFGANTLNGFNGDDILSGQGGADILIGGAGADLLDGGTGADSMTGGAGDDEFKVDNAGDVVIEALDEGLDTVETTLLAFILPDNVEVLTLLGTGNSAGTGNALDNVIIGNSGLNTLIGLDGDDRIEGLAGVDVIFAGRGADDVDGGAGDDVIAGGFDDDDLSGGIGADTVKGEAGDDRISGAAGEDFLKGGLGHDDLSGGLDADRLFGQSGDDELRGNGGDDTLTGLDGEDYLAGGLGLDALSGGAENDRLFGQANADTLNGGTG